MAPKQRRKKQSDAAVSAADTIEAIRAWSAQHGRLPTEQEWDKDADGHPSALSVSRRFGSWKGGLAAAGYPLEPGHRPLAR